MIPRAVSPSRWPANIGNDQLAGQDLEDISELLEGHNQAGRGITELFCGADGLVHLMSYRAMQQEGWRRQTRCRTVLRPGRKSTEPRMTRGSSNAVSVRGPDAAGL